MGHDDRMTDEAIAWAVRTGDPAFDDWDGFTAWLEADPAHSRAYDRAVAAVADAAEAGLPAGEGLASANDDDAGEVAPARASWRRFALAASIVLVAMLGFLQLRDPSYVVETGAGEARIVALADGSEIALGGAARVVLDRDDPRLARLEQGRALFTVRHDAADPFVVTVGEQTLVDAGTVFDVARMGATTAVAVSEGVVLVNPERKLARLEPGDTLSVTDGSDAYQLGSAPVARIGEWREGRLTFDDAPLSEIAYQLSSSTGIAFSAAPAVADRRVTGSVVLAPVRDDPQAIGALFGVSVRREGESWIIDRP